MSRFWNECFAAEHYIFGTGPNALLAAQRERLRPGMRALAIADGEGRNGVWLARQGRDVHAVDASHVALAKAARLARDPAQLWPPELLQTWFADWEIVHLRDHDTDLNEGTHKSGSPPSWKWWRDAPRSSFAACDSPPRHCSAGRRLSPHPPCHSAPRRCPHSPQRHLL